ncbi:unnamed protein product [Ascophyllum nodosum]
MPRRPWSERTTLFSSADSSSDDCTSDTTSESNDLWTTGPAASPAEGPGANFDKDEIKDTKGSYVDLSLPALAAAVRSSRARASASLAKASRLQEENLRLREALKAARRKAGRVERLEIDLETSERRVRELESDRRRIRRDMEGVKERANQTGAKTNLHVSELETALKDVEGRERARCRRWRASARSLRALLESLRRHLQRGHHATPSFTAFQLMEQLFKCLATQEADSCAPPQRPELTMPASPFPVDDEGKQEQAESSRDGETRKQRRTPPVARGGGRGRVAGGRNDIIGEGEDDEVERRRPRTRDRRMEDAEAETDAAVGVSDSAQEEGDSGKVRLTEPGDRGSSGGSSKEFPAREEAARFPTEWAYRLAVTKLTAKLRAARERLREEKEMTRSAGERADQEELRCRQLELEVEAMSAKVAAADTHLRRLEALLEEARRDRNISERKRRNTASHVLNAALGVVERKRSGAQSSVYPVPAAAPTSSRSPLENISRPSPAVAASGLANLGAESGWHLYPENVDRGNVGTRRSYRSREPNREEATASQPQDPPRPRPQSTPIPNLESLLRETRSGAAGDGGGLGLAAEEKGSDHFRRGLRDIARYEERLRGLGDEDRESERRRGLLAGIGRDGESSRRYPFRHPYPPQVRQLEREGTGTTSTRTGVRTEIVKVYRRSSAEASRR